MNKEPYLWTDTSGQDERSPIDFSLPVGGHHIVASRRRLS